MGAAYSKGGVALSLNFGLKGGVLIQRGGYSRGALIQRSTVYKMSW